MLFKEGNASNISRHLDRDADNDDPRWVDEILTTAKQVLFDVRVSKDLR